MSATTDNLDSVVSDAAFYLIPQLTSELKELATVSGWPKEVVNTLYVNFDGSTLSVGYPETASKMINDLEYGNGSNLPNSVIRSFIYRSGDTVKSVLANRTIQTMFDMEGVFGG